MKKLSFFLTLLLGAAALQAAPIDYLASTQSTPLKDISTVNAPAAVNGPRRAHKTYVTPEGTPLDYTMSYSLNSNTYPDIPVQVSFSEDGKSVYFGNLFPSFLSNDMNAWIKGDIQEDNTIVVKLQNFIDYDVNGDETLYYGLYAGAYDFNTGAMSDAYFVLNEDKSIKQQNLPVTIKYPEMVARIAPHFTGGVIPTAIGRNNLWFL